MAADAAADAGAVVDRPGESRGDRVGIGWRDDLAAGIFANLDRIDLVEVIAENYFGATVQRLRALRTLAGQVPLTLHGVSLGLASTVPVEDWRLERMARLVEEVRPESWSEHLAFVRGGGIEIGHLAAPPRTMISVEATAANIDWARRAVGAAPMVENIATLVEPPASTLGESAWISGIVAQSQAPLLLDLHNLYANALNFGEDPLALMLRLPLDRVGAVHLSGGKWIPEPGGAVGRRRLLDDHVHDVPPEVFALLRALASRVPQSLDVIIERDGNFPHSSCMMAQLDAARAALTGGRAMRPAGLAAA